VAVDGLSPVVQRSAPAWCALKPCPSGRPPWTNHDRRLATIRVTRWSRVIVPTARRWATCSTDEIKDILIAGSPW